MGRHRTGRRDIAPNDTAPNRAGVGQHRASPALGRNRFSRLPGPAQAVLVYLALRLITTLFTLRVAGTQEANLWTGAAPGYFDFTSIWDGSWYREIALDGYPSTLPVDETGKPIQSAWAFFPAYPLAVRLGMLATGLPFRFVGPTVSLLLGTLAAFYCYRLFRLKASHPLALAAVAIIAAWPSSPVMQYAYTESTCVLALAGVLFHMTRRSYVWALPWGVFVGLSRPVGMALVAAIALVFWHRWRYRRLDPFPVRERYGLIGLAAVTVASSSVMLVAVAVVGNRADAYTAVQMAWRAQPTMEYFTPWLGIFRYLAGPVVGPIALAALVALLVGVFLSRPARRLGPEMYGWSLAYVLYLAAVTDPYGQVFRLTLLLFPLALALADALGRRALILGWLVLSLALQYQWIAILWRFSPPADVAP